MPRVRVHGMSQYVPHITFQRYVDHDELEVFEGLLHEYAEVLKASDKA